MKQKKDKVRKCNICKRAITEDDKTGLCPKCLNKYGTPAAAVGVGALSMGVKIAIKHKDKIINGAIKVAKIAVNLIKK